LKKGIRALGPAAAVAQLIAKPWKLYQVCGGSSASGKKARSFKPKSDRGVKAKRGGRKGGYFKKGHSSTLGGVNLKGGEETSYYKKKLAGGRSYRTSWWGGILWGAHTVKCHKDPISHPHMNERQVLVGGLLKEKETGVVIIQRLLSFLGNRVLLKGKGAIGTT